MYYYVLQSLDGKLVGLNYKSKIILYKDLVKSFYSYYTGFYHNRLTKQLIHNAKF